MKFIFYSPVAFEPWDWRNSIETGIGGSETSHVEMAWRLAARGHQVLTYAPIPDDCPGEWRGTTWKHLDEVDIDLLGIWVIYRCPQFMDSFPKHPDQTVWLVCQDFDYPTLTPGRLSKIDKVLPLCRSHAEHILSHHKDCPDLRSKIFITSNGTKLDLIQEVESENIQRDPFRVMHASSPDRGLLPLLKSFKKAREVIPQLNLHAFYGFDNIDKLISQGARHLAQNKAEILKLASTIPNVTLHGRISQPQLYREWFKSGLYCYETNFWETSHISGQEAQCMGAIPIFSPVWGQSENLMHGISIPGDADDPLTQARFAAELVRLSSDHQLQAQIRQPMMLESRPRFDWDRMVNQWECELTGKTYWFDFPAQLQAPKLTPRPTVKSKPKISVLTPSIRPDRLQVLKDCLDAQSFRDFEWLVCSPFEYQLSDKWFPEPTKSTDDFYTLNKAWNLLANQAQGDLLVLYVDSTTCSERALQLFWSHYQSDPMLCVSGVGIQTHDQIIQWIDPRWPKVGGVIDPLDMEFRLASVPRKGWLDCGGQDPEFDRVAAWSDKELCYRLRKQGYRMHLDGNIFYWFEQHLPHTQTAPDWESKAVEGFQLVASKLARGINDHSDL